MNSVIESRRSAVSLKVWLCETNDNPLMPWSVSKAKYSVRHFIILNDNLINMMECVSFYSGEFGEIAVEFMWWEMRAAKVAHWATLLPESTWFESWLSQKVFFNMTFACSAQYTWDCITRPEVWQNVGLSFLLVLFLEIWKHNQISQNM